MPDEQVQPQAESKTNLTNVIVLVLGSLGLLGGGGGAYLVNNSVDEVQQEFRTTLAVVQNNVTHMNQAVEKLSQQMIDLNEGFQQEFKEHINNPGLHTQGMSRLQKEIQDEIDEKIDKLDEKLSAPTRKQWELIRELKDEILKLQAWKDSLENQ